MVPRGRSGLVLLSTGAQVLAFHPELLSIFKRALNTAGSGFLQDFRPQDVLSFTFVCSGCVGVSTPSRFVLALRCVVRAQVRSGYVFTLMISSRCALRTCPCSGSHSLPQDSAPHSAKSATLRFAQFTRSPSDLLRTRPQVVPVLMFPDMLSDASPTLRSRRPQNLSPHSDAPPELRFAQVISAWHTHPLDLLRMRSQDMPCGACS